MKRLWELFAAMFRIGLVSFGGGWSIVAEMERQFAEKREWITREELLDYVSVARSLPGIMVINTSVIFGYHLGGVAAALVCGFAVALPSFLVLVAVTLLYELVRSSLYVSWAMRGVQCAVVPIIINILVKLGKGGVVDKVTAVIAALALVLMLAFQVTPVLVVALGLISGLFFGRKREQP